jgi:hypothetical protein
MENLLMPSISSGTNSGSSPPKKVYTFVGDMLRSNVSNLLSLSKKLKFINKNKFDEKNQLVSAEEEPKYLIVPSSRGSTALFMSTPL